MGSGLKITSVGRVRRRSTSFPFAYRQGKWLRAGLDNKLRLFCPTVTGHPGCCVMTTGEHICAIDGRVCSCWPTVWKRRGESQRQSYSGAESRLLVLRQVSLPWRDAANAHNVLLFPLVSFLIVPDIEKSLYKQERRTGRMAGGSRFLWLQLTCSCGGGHLYAHRCPAKALATC